MENWDLTWTRLEDFTKSNINAIDDGLPGVYRLSYHQEADDSYYVFYIGESENIKSRLLELLESDATPCVKSYMNNYHCRFRYAKIAESYVRTAAVRQMFERFQPACNDKAPDAREDVKVNLT